MNRLTGAIALEDENAGRLGDRSDSHARTKCQLTELRFITYTQRYAGAPGTAHGVIILRPRSRSRASISRYSSTIRRRSPPCAAAWATRSARTAATIGSSEAAEVSELLPLVRSVIRRLQLFGCTYRRRLIAESPELPFDTPYTRLSVMPRSYPVAMVRESRTIRCLHNAPPISCGRRRRPGVSSAFRRFSRRDGRQSRTRQHLHPGSAARPRAGRS